MQQTNLLNYLSFYIKITRFLEKINLLLVENIEDEAIQVADYLGEIKDLDIEIHLCQSLSESYELLQRQKLDIILINLFLPDGYGLQSFTNLFNKFLDIPFLVLTDLNDNSIALEAVKSGAQDFISKENLSSSFLYRSISYAIERKQSEKKLRRSEEKYRQLFARSRDAIYMTTLEGEFIDFNPAALSLFGYSEEELKALKVKDLYIDEADRKTLRSELEKDGQITDYELVLQKKDKTTKIQCLLSSMTIYDEEKNILGYQGIIRDITDKKNAEQALLKSLADLDLANQEMHQLNDTLEQKVVNRTVALRKEKEIVEISSKEIKESIKYAKRIQASILPPNKRLKEGFKDSFVYYKPKDVVSGDFYWYEKVNKNALFAVVDCTGHGVPGAFMSMIGYTQLNEIVSQQKITDPGLILKELDKRVKIALHQNAINDKNSKDGMELGLIHLDFSKSQLEFAGAMRPLYLVRNGQLQIIKGSKFAIGGVTLRKKEFTTTRLQVKSGDSIYIFSDGYPDQFGGPRGKKFMTRNVEEMLRNIGHLSMVEQDEIVKQTIQHWMNEEEQVDDILFSGIKI